ncbi:MAG TPA: right-handed parallel beta-helix repeat-containing protein, partial [Planctomycetota bacterium]|nr:right-handed parallel beta-helix repeat-containing protein [Planctomycetota bacterium]
MRDAVVLALVFFVLSSARSAEWHVNNRHPACGDQNPGTIEQPFKTVGAANAKIQPGDSVLIYSGTYRERVEIAVSGQDGKPIVFRAAEGHYPIVTGADELLAWTAEDKKAGVYSAPWPHRFIDWSPTLTHPDDPYHRVIGRAENVWIDGYPLRQVLDAKQLARGTFFADLDKKRLLVCADHGGDISNRAVHCVEASVRADIWVTKGSHVHVRGLTFRYAANGAQNGAVKDLGAKNVYLDCVFEKSNGVGAAFTGNGTVVRRCVFHDHGQLGFAAVKAHNLTLTHCTIRRNNLKNYDRGWEAGANKLVLCRGVELAHSTFTDNYGNGVWFDIGNEDCSVHHCLIARNDGAGIFYEISHGL